MPSYPLHAAPPPPPSEFFTILAQYHAYAINRAQETKQRRNESIKKYREKKRRRNSSSRVVKYQMRKELADRRIRGPRGRFIRKEEENRILESQQAPLELNESTREQSSPEPTAPLDTFLQQQQREAFVSPLCCISHHRKPHRSNLFTETLGSYSPPWHYFS